MDVDDNESPAAISVHDLMWVANSPSLLDVSGGMTSMGNHNELFSVASDQPSLNQSEIDADHLQDFLAENPHSAVGRYFESLVYYWIKYIRGLEVLVCNEQIKRAGRTIGEIALVFRDEQDRFVNGDAFTPVPAATPARSPSQHLARSGSRPCPTNTASPPVQRSWCWVRSPLPPPRPSTPMPVPRVSTFSK